MTEHKLQITRLELQIHWADVVWALDSNLQRLGIALQYIPELESITVKWRPFGTQTWSIGELEGSPAAKDALRLLQPLRNSNSVCPAVMIEVSEPPQLRWGECGGGSSDPLGVYTALEDYMCGHEQAVEAF